MLFDINENLGDFFYDEPMKNHTSFCVGGPAKLLIKPRDEEALVEILKSIRKNNYKYYILGNCTNIIVRDKGFDGIIIKLKNKLNDVKKVSNKEIYAGTGASMKKSASSPWKTLLLVLSLLTAFQVLSVVQLL